MRYELARFASDLLDEFALHTSPFGAIHLGHTATYFDEHAAQLKGFSCSIWALAAILAGGHAFGRAKIWAKRLAAGTDPDGPELWVGCSAIGFAHAVAGCTLWNPLSEHEKD
jgi:hypothetical protein